eukprot:TRINITY_DN265_c0_g1_i1.p1 TRINITY_DN265_c0_g1~~TRINITY_DN265_c0_g1_i1.p1  ORF type:complete len:176 (-),score=31.13 TRINITY_DN265_c0_g1_i1:208-663(-)
MEQFACDWEDKGPKGGQCWACWEMEPCCGDPCNPKDGIMCFLCWAFCYCCSSGKLFSHTVDQECAFVNHCLYATFCGLCANVCVRHNLRVMYDIGDKEGGWVGDVLMAWCCGLCVLCQHLRSVDRSTWDWLTEVQEKGFVPMAEEFKFVRH